MKKLKLYLLIILFTELSTLVLVGIISLSCSISGLSQKVHTKELIATMMGMGLIMTFVFLIVPIIEKIAYRN